MTEGFFEPKGATAPDDRFPTVQRDRWGRYALPSLDGSGKTYGRVRCTTFAKSVEDFYNLSAWSERQVAYGLSLRPDLLALAGSATGGDDKDTLTPVVDQAKEAAASKAGANRGTALHAVTHQVKQGRLLSDFPVEFHADVLAYAAKLKELGIQTLPELTERIVLNDYYDVAGTFDDIVRLPDGTLAVGDLKTQKSLDFALGIAVQLAVYANARWLFDPATKSYEPMPEVRKDKALIFHVRPGSGVCEVYEINIAIGWWIAGLCADVRQARQIKQLVKPFLPGAPANTSASVFNSAGDMESSVTALEASWNAQQTASRDAEAVSIAEVTGDIGDNSWPGTIRSSDGLPVEADSSSDPAVEELAKSKPKPELQSELIGLTRSLGIPDDQVNLKKNRVPLAIKIIEARKMLADRTDAAQQGVADSGAVITTTIGSEVHTGPSQRESQRPDVPQPFDRPHAVGDQVTVGGISFTKVNDGPISPFATLPASVTEPYQPADLSDELMQKIRELPSSGLQSALHELWTKDRTNGNHWTEAHTEVATARLAQLTQQ